MSDSAIVCTYCGKTYSTDYDACPGCGTLRDAETTVPLVEPEPPPEAASPAPSKRRFGFGSGGYWAIGVGVSLLFVILALIVAGPTGNLNALILGLDVLAIVVLVANPWRLRARVPLVGSNGKLQSAAGWLGLGAIALVALATFPGGIVAMPIAPDAKPSPTPSAGATAGAIMAPAKSATSTVARLASPTASAARVLIVGNTGGDGAWLRGSPDMSDRLRAWTDGTRMAEVGPELAVDGRKWRNVRDPADNIGWMPAEYLVDEQSGAATAGTASPTPLATLSASAGKTVTANGRSLTIAEVVTLREVGQEKAELTKEYVVLTLTIKNTDSKRIAYSRLDFRIEDGNGHITKPVAVTGLDNQLYEGELAPGGSVKGFLVFEVPEGDLHLALIWVPCASGCAEKDIPLGGS